MRESPPCPRLSVPRYSHGRQTHPAEAVQEKGKQRNNTAETLARVSGLALVWLVARLVLGSNRKNRPGGMYRLQADESQKRKKEEKKKVVVVVVEDSDGFSIHPCNIAIRRSGGVLARPRAASGRRARLKWPTIRSRCLSSRALPGGVVARHPAPLHSQSKCRRVRAGRTVIRSTTTTTPNRSLPAAPWGRGEPPMPPRW